MQSGWPREEWVRHITDTESLIWGPGAITGLSLTTEWGEYGDATITFIISTLLWAADIVKISRQWDNINFASELGEGLIVLSVTYPPRCLFVVIRNTWWCIRVRDNLCEDLCITTHFLTLIQSQRREKVTPTTMLLMIRRKLILSSLSSSQSLMIPGQIFAPLE